MINTIFLKPVVTISNTILLPKPMMHGIAQQKTCHDFRQNINESVQKGLERQTDWSMFWAEIMCFLGHATHHWFWTFGNISNNLKF